MKATGIVRRIDDLGRVVIPKEIRRTMRIREGDPLEIYTDRNGEVIFKKYSPMGELNTFVSQLCDSVTKTTGASCAICDRDSVIAVSGSAKKDVCDRSISEELEHIMEQRRIFRPEGRVVSLTPAVWRCCAMRHIQMPEKLRANCCKPRRISWDNR